MATFLNQFAIVLVDRALCRTRAVVGDHGRRKGRPIQAADAWIAATAIALGVPLVTHNRDDFASVDDLLMLPAV
jgi:predicted nucleic acid-binding protein